MEGKSDNLHGLDDATVGDADLEGEDGHGGGGLPSAGLLLRRRSASLSPPTGGGSGTTRTLSLV